MNNKALTTLEFNKIIQQVANKAISNKGKNKVLSLKPYKSIEEINLAQLETTEAIELIIRKGSLPLGGIKDISESIKRVLVDGTLSIEELMNIGDFLYVCKKAKDYMDKDEKSQLYEITKLKFESIMLITKLKNEINRCIININEIADDATNELYEIRRDINVSNDRIKENLNKIIHSQKYKTMIQENVITIRNNRYCIPIKQEYQNSFQGMVHDQSSTGATVFMEPISIVQLNNKIKELKLSEKKEIEKILYFLSELVREEADSLSMNSEILTELDFIFAKGEYSLEINGTKPIFNNKGYVNIKKGRHPLLDKVKVVPTDIYIGKDFNMLLVTGPNTGGKTVALKTIGLFVLMGQAGLHISAEYDSELAIFDNVFADIGDEQSIEQSLSTFSSHMTNIVKILQNATDNSLILLDELGAGTDPTEGAALAISILQYLKKRKIRTVVTTHYSELKIFALSDDMVENASCEFNIETLMPSYKLLIGIPGKSNAFAISKKLGLPDYIISDAKNILSHEETKFEDIITDLEISRKTLILEQDNVKRYKEEASKLKNDLEARKRKIEEQGEKVLNEARIEARKVLQLAKKDADDLIKQINKQAKNKSSNKELDETRQKIGSKLSEVDNSIKNNINNKPKGEPITKKLVAGDKVFVNSLNQTGTVISGLDRNGNIMIQSGAMKVKINIKDLSLDTSVLKKEKNNLHSYNHASKITKSQDVSMELSLRGCLVEEALQRLDKYIDTAYLSNVSKVRVIHGKGTGALRTGVHNYLKTNPAVKSYRIGEFGEGDSGVTIVELK